MSYWDQYALVSAPASDPVTVAECKAELRIDTGDEDSHIEDLIGRAVGVIDGNKGIGICMVSQQWKLTLDCFPLTIRIELGPVLSVDSITYVDTTGTTQTLAASEYRVTDYGDRVTITEAYDSTWPSTRDVAGAVVVTFTAGFSSVPAILKQAVIMTVRDWFERPESDGMLPKHVERILNQYRVGTIAA